MNNLSEKQQVALEKIGEYVSETQKFSAADLSKMCGGKISPQALNALASKNILQKFDTTPRTYCLKSKSNLNCTENNSQAQTQGKGLGSAIKILSRKASVVESRKRLLAWMEDGVSVDPNGEVGIYKIIDNSINQVVYIGKTEVTFQARWKQHKEDLKNGTHHCAKLQERFNRLNKDFSLLSFEVELPCQRDSSVIDESERLCIQKYDELYPLDNTVKPQPKLTR